MSARAVPFSALPDDTLAEAIRYVGENLREADVAEIRATMVGDPAEILQASAMGSTLGWVMVNATGLPVALFGVAPHGIPGVGVPWMVATPEALKERLSWARQTRRHVDEMLEVFPTLTNHIDARNDASLDWLLWAGFDLIDAKSNHGPEGRLFLQFMKAR
ncbi:hypothetical protein [Sphingopyxis flava]|uniref:hypothetical protein n=1 Tax=Sphingopyxis flava TaxID=1507287 RepID=UPI001116B750|nr:hypothetical protein [Sphingopyxis flava]